MKDTAISRMQRVVKRLLDGMGQRSDAGETASFARQLEYIKTKTYDVEYANLLVRKFVPVDNSIPSGAESFTWRQWDWFGMAAILSNFADDLPKVDVIAAEVTQGIKSLGASYSYTLQDLRASAMAGTQLDTKRASAARRAVENKIEAIGAVGQANANLPGFLNHANVPLVSFVNGAWLTGPKTPTQILADLNTLANSIPITTKQVHSPDTMLLPPTLYNYIASTPMSTTDNRTILTVFLQNSPYIKNVDQWYYLETAGAANATRIVCYERSPDVLGLIIPQEFEQLPPQPSNLAFTIPCHARIGGVCVYYPLAMAYMDGC